VVADSGGGFSDVSTNRGKAKAAAKSARMGNLREKGESSMPPRSDSVNLGKADEP
jgi:hypothetical protein